MASAKLIWYVYVTSFFCKYIFTRNINHRYFNFLFEPLSLKMPLICSYLLSIFTLTTLEKCITELMKSSHASILNLIRRNLASAEKNCLVLYHTAASIKLYILTYSVLEMQYKITSSTQCHKDHLMLKTNQFYMTGGGRQTHRIPLLLDLQVHLTRLPLLERPALSLSQIF